MRAARPSSPAACSSGILAAWPQRDPTFGYEPAEAAIVARTAGLRRSASG
jgi:hypothetical protein